MSSQAERSAHREVIPGAKFLRLLLVLFILYEAMPRWNDGFDVPGVASVLESSNQSLTREWLDSVLDNLRNVQGITTGDLLSAEQQQAWADRIVDTLADMGLEDDHTESPAIFHLENEHWQGALLSRHGGYVTFPATNAVYLRPGNIYSDASHLRLLVHEIAHLKADHTLLRSRFLEQGLDDSHPFPIWQPEFVETQAEVLSIEVLARMYYGSHTEAEKGLLLASLKATVQRVVYSAAHFELYLSGRLDPQAHNARSSTSFYYGYAPMLTLEQLVADSDTTLPVMEHGWLGLPTNLESVSLENTRRFLLEIGVTSLDDFELLSRETDGGPGF